MYFRFIPESPRFLIIKNRKEEAFKVFNQIARYNGRGNLDLLSKYDLTDDEAEKKQSVNDVTTV